MKNYLRKFIIAFLIFLCASLCHAFHGDKILFSNGSELLEFSIENNEISRFTPLLDSSKWSYVSWPSCSKQKNLIFIEAQNADFGLDRFIFSMKMKPLGEQVTKIIQGLKPAISSDGNYLAYYKHPQKLMLRNLKTSVNRVLASNFVNHQPVVWLTDRILIFYNTEDKLMKMDITTGVATDTGHYKVIPGSLSPKGDKVLCGNYEGNKIFIYIIETNELEEIVESKVTSIGNSFVWLKNSKNFLYTRQTFSNLIKFNESRSLFLYNPKGKDPKLVNMFSLFGGVTF